MGRLSSARRKYFLCVSMNKICPPHYNCSRLGKQWNFGHKRVLIIEPRISPVVIWWRKITRSGGRNAAADRLLYEADTSGAPPISWKPSHAVKISHPKHSYKLPPDRLPLWLAEEALRVKCRMVAVGGDQTWWHHLILTVAPFTVETIKEEDKGGFHPLPIKVNHQITWQFTGNK